MDKDKVLLNMYLDDLISDLDTEIMHHSDLHFYIVGQSIVLQKQAVNCSKLDVNRLFYSAFFDEKKCYQSFDANEEFTEIINQRLKEYAGTRENAHFVDRNEGLFAFMSGKHKVYNIRVNGEPVYIDDNHYTYLGSKYIGERILNQILNDQN